MRLFSLTLVFLLVTLIIIILFPALFLEATKTILSDSQQQQIGGELARISLIIGRPATSSAVYDLLIIKNPESADLYRLKSESLLADNNIPAALTSLDAAIARDPENPVLLNKKARILIRNGRMNEAEIILDRIIAIKTDNPDYLSEIAGVTLEKALYPEALDRYTRLLTLKPDDGLIYEKRSDVIFALLTIPTAGLNASSELRKQDLYSEGIQGYQRAIMLMPDRSASITAKMNKRSDEYVPRTIEELQSRYTQFRYLQQGEEPLPTNQSFR